MVVVVLMMVAPMALSAAPPDGSHTIGPPYTVQPALTPQGRQRGVSFVPQIFITAISLHIFEFVSKPLCAVCVCV